MCVLSLLLTIKLSWSCFACFLLVCVCDIYQHSCLLSWSCDASFYPLTDDLLAFLCVCCVIGQPRSRSPPPLPRERERDYAPPPPPRLDDHRLAYEDRLERLLIIEREMAYMQAREELYSEVLTRSQLEPPSMYDQRRDDGYHSRPPLSPPPPPNPYSSSRDRDYPGDRNDRGGGLDDRRPYYSRSEASGMSLHGSGHDSRPEPLLSYPLPRNRAGNSHRGADLLAGAYGGAATSGKSVGYGSGSYGSSKTPASGGYSLGKSSSGGGWPDYARGGGGGSSGGRSGPYSGGGGGGGYWN